jgi:hypothetical protein
MFGYGSLCHRSIAHACTHAHTRPHAHMHMRMRLCAHSRMHVCVNAHAHAYAHFFAHSIFARVPSASALWVERRDREAADEASALLACSQGCHRQVCARDRGGRNRWRRKDRERGRRTKQEIKRESSMWQVCAYVLTQDEWGEQGQFDNGVCLQRECMQSCIHAAKQNGETQVLAFTGPAHAACDGRFEDQRTAHVDCVRQV